MEVHQHVDLLEQLRFQRWARENYVTPQLRSKQWHPIVLEAMERIDEEKKLYSPETGSVIDKLKNVMRDV